MASPFLPALDAEIAQLRAELAADPRLLKLKELERVRKLYSDDSGQSVTMAAPSSKGGMGRTPSARTARVLEVSEVFLRNRNKGILGRPIPTHTQAILDYVQQQPGVEIIGKNRRNSLSALLSHSPRFRSHGRYGWTLTENETDSASQNTETADTPAWDASAASAEPRPDQRGNGSTPVNPWPGGGG